MSSSINNVNTTSQAAISAAEAQAEAVLHEGILEQDAQVESQIMNNINTQDHTVVAPEKAPPAISNTGADEAQKTAASKRRALRIGTSDTVI